MARYQKNSCRMLRKKNRHSLSRAFLSYAHSDDMCFVRRLYRDLGSHGVDVWWDQVNLSNYTRDILVSLKQAIEKAEHMIIVVGPKAVTSNFVRAEWEHALYHSKGITLAVRKLHMGSIPEELSTYGCIDFLESHTYEQSLHALLGSVLTPTV